MASARTVPCETCGTALCNDEIALGVKLGGLSAPRLKCLACLAREYQTSVPELEALIEYYRQSGCVHFQRDYLA